MELSKLKPLQQYPTPFEQYYRNFKHIPQRHRLSTIFNSTLKELYETLETEDVDMSTAHSMIEPIFNCNYEDDFHHQNRK